MIQPAAIITGAASGTVSQLWMHLGWSLSLCRVMGRHWRGNSALVRQGRLCCRSDRCKCGRGPASDERHRGLRRSRRVRSARRRLGGELGGRRCPSSLHRSYLCVLILECTPTVAFAVTTFGGVTTLVNNAGIGGTGSPVQDTTLEEWQKVNGVTSTGVFLGMKKASGELFKQGKKASVVCASSSPSRSLRLTLLEGSGTSPPSWGSLGTPTAVLQRMGAQRVLCGHSRRIRPCRGPSRAKVFE